MPRKVIACIGDSLTEGDYGVFNTLGIANVQTKNYPYFLKELSRCEVKNFGHCGFTSLMILNLFDIGYINVSKSDIIVILLGTNGGQTKAGDSENDLAYKQIIKLCKEQSPRATIFICTPPKVTQNPKRPGYSYRDNAKSGYEFVIELAKQDKTLELIDLYNELEFDLNNDLTMSPNDGLHFGEYGYFKIAETIYKHMRKILMSKK